MRPSHTALAARARPGRRLSEYLDVFVRLLATPEGSGIVFVENSRALRRGREQRRPHWRRRVPQHPQRRLGAEDGRAYGETLLVRHAVDERS